MAAVAWCVLALAVGTGYATGVAVLTRRGDRWAWHRTLAATGAVGCLLVAAAFGRRDGFRDEACLHQLVASLLPRLLALSAPVTLSLRALAVAPRRRLLRVLHSPAVVLLSRGPVVLVLQVGTLYAVYLTPLYAAAEHRPLLHALLHAHMLASGCLFAWYVLAIDPVAHRPDVRARVGILVAAAGAHDVLAKLVYAHGLAAAGGQGDVPAGAEVLYYGGDAVELAMLVVVLTGWYASTGRVLRRERRHALFARM